MRKDFRVPAFLWQKVRWVQIKKNSIASQALCGRGKETKHIPLRKVCCEKGEKCEKCRRERIEKVQKRTNRAL